MTSAFPPSVVLAVIVAHFLCLLAIGHLTGRRAGNAAFFVANRAAPWWLVGIGVVGATISGITFVSVPGAVGTAGLNRCFSYFQFVLGNMAGYAISAVVLLPVYYRMNLVSIYGYLEQRFGIPASKTGAVCFMLGRLLGTAIRLYIFVVVLQTFVLGPLGVPFPCTAIGVPLVIWAYTFRGGTKTLVFTNAIQAILFIVVVVLTLWDVATQLGGSLGSLWKSVWHSSYSQVFFFSGGWSDPNNFFKQFLSGALMTTCATGLDQSAMQRNLSCRNLHESRKNMLLTSLSILFVNLLFLVLGAALYIFVFARGLTPPQKSDDLYAFLSFHYLSPVMALLFMMGLLACTYSTTDSSLISITTSFCIDILGFERKKSPGNQTLEVKQRKKRFGVHLGFTLVLIISIFVLQVSQAGTTLNVVFDLLGYTYGPILGLFAFGFLTSWQVRSAYVPAACVCAVILTYLIDSHSAIWFSGLRLGFTKLAVNGLLTFVGLWLIRESADGPARDHVPHGASDD
jgi:Na+/proline symporter